MAWTAKDFVKELKDVEKLLAFKTAPVLQESLLGALLKKIECSNSMLPSDYVTMLEAVDESGLDEDKKTWLKDKLMERVAGEDANASGNKIIKSPQSLVNIAAYMTKAELSELMTGELTKAPLLIVRRLRLAGITSIKEDTKRYAVALLVQAMLWHGMQMPDGDYTYMVATQFTKLFQASTIEAKVAPLKVYPELPTQLGEEWLKKVYGDDAPSLKVLPQLPEIASQVVVRSTNSNLSWNSHKRLKGKQSVSEFSNRGEFLQALRDLVNVEEGGATASSSKSLKMTIFDQKPSPNKILPSDASAVALLAQKKMGQASASPAKAPLALTDGPSTEGTKETPASHAVHTIEEKKDNDMEKDTTTKAKSLQDFEEEAMNMLLKKPAIENKKVPASVLKKPASKNTPTKEGKGTTKKDLKLKRTVFGCLRCRGAPGGCDVCRSETFNGKRFEGRDDYNKFVKAQAAKGKVYK